MSNKLKGHKPACKCVGCSAATRARGMKKLGLTKRAPKSHSKRKKMMRGAIKKLADLKKFPNKKRRKNRNPLTRKEVAEIARSAKADFTFGKRFQQGHTRSFMMGAAEAKSNVLAKYAQKKARKSAAKISLMIKKRRESLGANPRKRRHSNPHEGQLIGTSPVLHTSKGKVAVRGGRVTTGPGEHRVTIHGLASGSHILGARVLAIDYRHDAKAKRAYGRVAPFRHKFTSLARVLQFGGGRIVVESANRIWEKQ